ncbi:MAG: NmrA family NAD(P)-binding protein, partial [Proteobacteria bacterium]|nr:NmrA family NAD(P)-binding protein [Pseudomonadota bacterium]
MFGKQNVLVVGATGQQGGAVARVLLNKGHSVRALTRSADSKGASYLSAIGAELMVGDLMDPQSLKRAVEGVNSVFMVTTPYEI